MAEVDRKEAHAQGVVVPEAENDATSGNIAHGRASDARARILEISARYLRKQEAPVVDATVVICAAAVYGVLYFAIGKEFLPGHPAWATLLLWASSHVGALIAHYLYFPRVIGMLGAGLILSNVPWDAVTAFRKSWGVQMRAAALATIFLRCGLELDFNTMKRYKYPAIRLALIPGLCEAFFDGGIASTKGIFNMPILLAFAMGFILKAVGPGLVVPTMFKLQRAGLGKDQGIPSTVVISASFDDIIAITGFAIFSHVAITGQGDPGWEIAQGPVQVVFGIVGGLLAGVVLGCTRIFDSTLRRLVGLYGAGLLIMFFLEYWGMLSGGAIGALFVGLTTSNFWEKGIPRRLSSGSSFTYSPEMERYLAVMWNWVMEPILFVTIGSSIQFSTLPSGTIGKAILVVSVGLIVRICTTFVCMIGLGYNWRERLFFAIAWSPKATIQASLSAAPLAMIETYKKGADNYEEWVGWGYDILTTGLFAIIICATLGLLAIYFFAPRLLEQSLDTTESTRKPSVHDLPEPVRGDVEQDDASVKSRRVDFAAGISRPLRTKSFPSGSGDLQPSGRLMHDYELVALYIDAIRQLTAAATLTKIDREEVQRLSEAVLQIQKRIETEVGQRDVTVRELFRTAAAMANEEFVVRHSSRQRSQPDLGSDLGAGVSRPSSSPAPPELDVPNGTDRSKNL